MSKKKIDQEKGRKSTGIYLGDESFNKKLSIYYSWFAPVVLSFLALILFVDKAHAVGLLVLGLAFFLSPFTGRFKIRLPSIFKVLIVLGFIYLIFKSMYLYI